MNANANSFDGVDLNAIQELTVRLRKSNSTIGQSPLMKPHLVLFLRAAEAVRQIIDDRLYTLHSNTFFEYFWNAWRLQRPELEHLYDAALANQVSLGVLYLLLY